MAIGTCTRTVDECPSQSSIPLLVLYIFAGAYQKIPNLQFQYRHYLAGKKKHYFKWGWQLAKNVTYPHSGSLFRSGLALKLGATKNPGNFSWEFWGEGDSLPKLPTKNDPFGRSGPRT